MKKAILVVFLLLTLAACSNIVILDDEGFRLFAYGEFITKDNACVQSHDGFMVNGKIYTELIADRPLTVQNLLDHEITVKVTDIRGPTFRPIDPFSSLTIEADK